MRAAEAEHTIEALSERTPRGFYVKLRLFGRGGRLLGERKLETRQSRAALTAPAAFVIAMMIDPEVVAHGLPPELMALLGEDAPEEQLLAQLEREPARPAPPPLATSASPRPARPDQAKPEPAQSPSVARMQVAGCLAPALRLRHARGQGFGRDQDTTCCRAVPRLCSTAACEYAGAGA